MLHRLPTEKSRMSGGHASSKRQHTAFSGARRQQADQKQQGSRPARQREWAEPHLPNREERAVW